MEMVGARVTSRQTRDLEPLSDLLAQKIAMSTYIGPEDQLEEHVEWMRMAVEMVRRSLENQIIL
jgi:hypothetical protein